MGNRVMMKTGKPGRRGGCPLLLLFVVLGVLLSCAPRSFSGVVRGGKVLVVASYHAGYNWEEQIISGLKQELPGVEWTVFYMDTKRNLAGASRKGAEAFRLYQEIRPDAVITLDDNAQDFFVVPYLREKVETPVIFCGVNDDASRYGFPAANVTGVLEKKHYRESISFAQFIEPSVRKVAVLYRPSPSNRVNLAQIEKEKGTYTAEIIAVAGVQTVAEAMRATAAFEADADALLLLNMSGLVDDDGNRVEGERVIRLITEKTNLVTIGVSSWEIAAGALAGVVKSGEEQGRLAAELLLAHWQGRGIDELPVTSNRNGRRSLNLATLNRLKIPLRPDIIVGTKIVPGSRDPDS